MGKALSIPLLAYLIFKGYTFFLHLDRKRIRQLEKEKQILTTSTTSWERGLNKSQPKAVDLSEKYPFSKWCRDIANCYQNILFYEKSVRQAGLPSRLVLNSQNLSKQATLIMDSLQQLSNIGRLNNSSDTIDNSQSKLKAIENKLIQILESGGQQIESVIDSITISEYDDFDVRIEGVKRNGNKVLQLLKTKPMLQEEAFYIEKLITVRLDELVEDYHTAKINYVSHFNKNPDDIMNEALNTIEKTISDINERALGLAHTESINKMLVNKRYFEERSR